jgi:hypothetical protein
MHGVRCVLTGLLSAVTFLVFALESGAAIRKLANPEFAAIQYILKHMGQ